MKRRDFLLGTAAAPLCGQTLATLTQKEVMISQRVVDRKISMSLNSGTREEATAAFRRAIEALGVRIIAVAGDTIILVDASDVAKEKRG